MQPINPAIELQGIMTNNLTFWQKNKFNGNASWMNTIAFVSNSTKFITTTNEKLTLNEVIDKLKPRFNTTIKFNTPEVVIEYTNWKVVAFAIRGGSKTKQKLFIIVRK